jgi:hypothetical protein
LSRKTRTTAPGSGVVLDVPDFPEKQWLEQGEPSTFTCPNSDAMER